MVLPVLAIAMLTIIGMIGLSVDVGRAFLNKTRLQNSLDSAALSGARTLMLTGDVAAAGAEARNVFEAHLVGNMSGLDGADLVFQYSDKLVPFVAGGSSPRYVRAALESFDTGLSFAGVLPNVDGSISIAGTAVAGPAPLGYPGAAKTCDIAPIMVCGSVGDSECSDGACFGYRVGSRTEYEFGFRHGIDDDLRAAAAESSLVRLPRCGEGSVYHDCIPMPGGIGGPGNALLHELACNGGNCIREGLAGSFDACTTDGSRVSVESDVAVGPALQGLSTRFDTEYPSLHRSDYPPDVVITGRADDVDYWYDEYRRDVGSIIATGSGGDGIPYRRVVTVPVVSCSDDVGGGSANTVLGFLCLFLTRIVDEDEVDGKLYGQFVSRCEASGERGASVPAVSGDYDGPFEIVLYKDPDVYDS